PGSVFPIWDDDEPDKMIGCHIAEQYYLPKEKDPEQKTRVRRLTYRIVENANGVEGRRISRQEAIFELEGSWLDNSEKAKKIQDIIPFGFLDARITTLPIYWFRNRSWDGEQYGSSDLRGIEAIAEIISQGSTDISAALSLEGLGVYATDGGRPVRDDGNGGVVETDWEVAPGRVMEV